MSFKKGTSGNAKGKPKGAQNKIKLQAKELFSLTLEGQIPNIEQAFREVYKKDKAKYLEILVKYVQYFIPKKTDILITEELPAPQIILDWRGTTTEELKQQINEREKTNDK